MRPLLLALALALTCPPLTALVDPTPDVQKMSTDDCARARKLNKTCVLSIESEQVEGQPPTVGDGPLTFPDFTRASSLIRLRRDFIVEILRSAENL